MTRLAVVSLLAAGAAAFLLGTAAGQASVPAQHCAVGQGSVVVEIYDAGAAQACTELRRDGWRPARVSGGVLCTARVAGAAALIRDTSARALDGSRVCAAAGAAR